MYNYSYLIVYEGFDIDNYPEESYSLCESEEEAERELSKFLSWDMKPQLFKLELLPLTEEFERKAAELVKKREEQKRVDEEKRRLRQEELDLAMLARLKAKYEQDA